MLSLPYYSLPVTIPHPSISCYSKTPCRPHSQQSVLCFSSILNRPEHFLRDRLFACGLVQFCSRGVQLLHANHLFLGIFQAKVGVGVHGDANVRMTHQVLQCLWIHSGFRHVGAIGVPTDVRGDSRHTISVLTSGNFNHRLLSEMICHKDFQRMMLDAEIYVDRIADIRITDMNAVMEAVRQSVIKKKGNDQEDLYLRTLELAQVQEDEYFGHVVSKDLTSILRDIRDTHRKDATTADESCAALEVQKQLQDAMDYKGSTEEKKARLFLANLGIDYDALTMEQFTNLIEVLKLSKHMNSPISQRGKGSMTHGKGKRKRK